MSLRRVSGARVLLSRVAEWWQSYFDSKYLLEYEPLFNLERDRIEAARLIEILGLPLGSRVLDVPCGQGRHAHLLAEAGFNVDGVDYSEHLLEVARKRGTGSNLRYRRADMRKLPLGWSNRFDGVVNVGTSFGFFVNPNDDVQAMSEMARVLRPDGVFVFHSASRDGVMSTFLSSDWWETSDGTLVAQQRSFDPLSGILTVETTLRAVGRRSLRRQHRVRLYTANQVAELGSRFGLIVEEAFDSFSARPLSRRSAEMLLVGRKES